MIEAIFQLASEIILIRVAGNSVGFANSTYGATFSTIEGLKLSKSGVIKEFPDLKDKENWKEEAIKRFRKKIASLPTERQKMNYIIEDLKKHGYKPKWEQVYGYRRRRLDG